MNMRFGKSVAILGVLAAALLLAAPAQAFRCGSKLIKDGMHEQQVLSACGPPTTVRHLGYALRDYHIRSHIRTPGWTITRSPGYGTFTQQVVVTEYVYNFGPRKFMRRLVFEGGVLVSIEKIGRGYHDRKR